MNDKNYTKIAIQKSGRLHRFSVELLNKCGINFEIGSRLLTRCYDYPIELMLIRHEDIPNYVESGICQLGIVGLNELEEKIIGSRADSSLKVLKKLSFGHCRLSLAVPKDGFYDGLNCLKNKRIATSYPNILDHYMKKNAIPVEIVSINGSVELAPSIGLADAVCDIVSTGVTLESNGLREVQIIMESQAALISNGIAPEPGNQDLIDSLVVRIEAMMKAEKTRYVIMNAPKDVVDQICELLPVMNEPTVFPMAGRKDRVSIHALVYEEVFWGTVVKLKSFGASSIVVANIEKMIE